MSFSYSTEGSIHAFDLNSEQNQVVIVGRSILKIVAIENDRFTEKIYLKSANLNGNLNYCCNDVSWNPCEQRLIATAAANGAVLLWNLSKAGKTKQEHVFHEHKRTVNKVGFHPTDGNLLLSGSHEGSIKLLDVRALETISHFSSCTESIRDVQFNPHSSHQFASVSDNGKVQLWDLRRAEKCERTWPAHADHVFACDWHSEIENYLVSSSRDKSIKVWDTRSTKNPLESIFTTSPVGRVKWRPGHWQQIASCSASHMDSILIVWNLKRPFLPWASFNGQENYTTSIMWKKNDSNVIFSCSKDGLLTHHHLNDASHPTENANPAGLSINNYGDVSSAFRKPSINSIRISNSGPGGGLLREGSESLESTIESKRGYKGGKFNKEYIESSSSLSQLYIFKQLTVSSEEHLTDMTWFVTSANKYMITGKSLGLMCEHNSTVAYDLKRIDVAKSWLIVKTLYETQPCNENQETVNSLPSSITTTPEVFNRSRHKSGNNRSAHLSTSKRKHCSSGHDVRLHSEGNNSISQNSEDEESEEGSQSLTTFENDLILNDGVNIENFFGDSEFSSLCVDQLIGQSEPLASDLSMNWILQNEAFDPRHEIKESTSHAEAEELFQDENSDESPIDTVSLNSSFSLLTVDPNLLFPRWSPETAIKETLVFYAEQGDVQMAVSLYLVLGHERLKGLLEESLLEHWFLSYIELLQRFQMFNLSTQIIRLCPLSSVNQWSQTSTMYFTNCTNCSKALNRSVGAWWCERCQMMPNLCAVCHKIVRGLFVWCQGCGHGGHIDHMKDWWESKKTLCPTGCGHHCEYH